MAKHGLWKPIARRSTTALIPDLLGLHTIVGGAAGTWNYFNDGAGGRGVYSHFLVHGKWSKADTDGTLWQCQDTAYRAAANLNGNYRIISVETADNAARPIEEWTPAQEATIVDLMVWAYRVHGIPLQLVPDSKPGRRGICYHEQGCDPVRAAGGELWSEAYGKDCPTTARIRRIPVLIERAQNIVNGGSPPNPPEDFMGALTDTQQLDLYKDMQDCRTDLSRLDRRTNWQTDAIRAVAAQVGATLPVYDGRADVAYVVPDQGETVVQEVARESVSPAELTTALKQVLADLPEVDLTEDAITRVAQSTATLIAGNTDPADPHGV